MTILLKNILKNKVIELYDEWKDIEKTQKAEFSLLDIEERSLYIPFKEDCWSDILIQDQKDSILIISENLSFTIPSPNTIKISKENLSISILNDKNLMEILSIDFDVNTAAGDIEGLNIKNDKTDIIITMLKSNLTEQEKMIYVKLISSLINYFLIT